MATTDQIPDDVYVDDDGSPESVWVPYGDEQEALRHAAAILDEDSGVLVATRCHLRRATSEECARHGWEPPGVMQCQPDEPGAQECWRVELHDD